MKKLSVRCSVFLFVLLSMLLLVGCGPLRELTSTDEPEIIVFQTGSPWLAILGGIFLVLMGLLILLFGIWVAVNSVMDFAKNSKYLKALVVFLVGLMLALGGVLILLIPFFWSSYFDRVTINKSSMTIEAEKKYFLRHEMLRAAFADISYVKYQTGSRSAEAGHRRYGEVKLVFGDGREIQLSEDGPKSQYELAQRISEFTHKKLVE